MTLQELKQKRAAILDKIEALVKDEQEREERGFSDEENTQFQDWKAEVESLNKDIDNRAWLDTMSEEDFETLPKDTGHRRGGGRITRDEGSDVDAPAILTRRVKDTPESIYCHYLRTGSEAAANEIRAYNDTDMNVTTAADGEVTVPVGMVRDIVARRDEMSLVPRLGVRRVPGKGTTVNYPVDDEADVVFASVAESVTFAQDAPALTEKAFTLVKYGKYITLTYEILRDEDAGLLSFLQNWIAHGWAGTHNSLLVTEVLANGTAGLTLDSATAIGAAEIPELVGKVLPEYQDGSQWLMHPGTKAYLEGLTGDDFLFAPTPGGSRGQELWGYPNNTSSYMTANQASAKSLVFGNFDFMGMREGTSLQTLRDPYTRAINGQVRLWFWFDAVFGVLQAEALQYATHPSA